MNKEHSNNRWLYHIAYAMAWGILFYAFYFCLQTLTNAETGNGDNVEHLHATWLVAQGKMPYRDFFQHHNPLMWYMFAPFLSHITDILKLLDTAHAISIVTGILTFWITYKICVKFFASPLASFVAILIMCPPYFYVYCFNYNPDTFMALFFALGLYALLSYWQKQKFITLSLSFLFFFISFMMTQKVLVALFFLGLASIYMFYRNKTKLQDILYALMLPIALLILFIAWLYYNDALGVYYQSNYTFNVVMQKYYGFDKISVVDHEMVEFALGLSLISVPFLYRKASRIYQIMAILFVIEFLFRYFYFSIAPYYFLILMIYCCCLNSVIIEKITNKYFSSIYLFLALAIYYGYISMPRYQSVRPNRREFVYYLRQNIRPCDYVLSSYFGNQSIISKDPHYYWSMLGHVDMAGEEIGITPHPDINKLILDYKPKLIYGGIYWNSYYKHRGQNVAIQQVSSRILNEYYLPTPFPDFYILKYEYRQKNCQYNKEKGEWLYEQ